MLDSLLIRNFRLFKELRIDHLARVNLFVGKNNTGKSCLLEALQVYATNANPAVLFDLVSARDGYWEAERTPRDEQAVAEVESPLRYLFHGYHLPELGEEDNALVGIEIGSALSEMSQTHIYKVAYLLARNIREELVPVRYIYQSELLERRFENIETVLVLKEGNKSPSPLISLSEDLRDLTIRRRFLQTLKEAKYNLQVVPARSMSDDRAASLWDKIDLTDFEDDVVSCLQIIQPSIKGVAFVGEVGHRIPIIRNEGVTERLPLRNLGDGVTRFFHIILALVNARDGFLLIDEFENGLHWRIQPKLWESIFLLAEKLNVQVFATTHSQDCVRSFYSAWTKNEALGSFHRLNPDLPDRPKCTAYTCEDLSDALETDVEVR